MQEFNYHSHTYRCKHADMDYTDEEYVQDYIKNGFKKIAFTDHAPEKRKIDKRNNMRMDYDKRQEYYDAVDSLKEKYIGQIEIQKGFEIEFLPDDIENMLELKAETDKLILGQHFVYADNGKDLHIFGEKQNSTDTEFTRYADYLEEAMKLHIPDIIAHPDLCFSGRERFGELEEKVSRRICEAAEKYNIPLEINLNGIFHKVYYTDKVRNNNSFEDCVKALDKVIYPTRNFWKIVTEYNIKVVYGVDTHCRGQIDLYSNLVKLSHILLGEEIIKKLNFVQDM